MSFITEGKTNWTFIGIIAVFAAIAVAGIWFLSALTPEEPVIPEEVTEEVLTEEGEEVINGEERMSIIYPSGGEEWVAGNTYEIKWTPLENIETVRIALYNKDVRTYEEELASGYPNTGIFKWKAPSILRPQAEGYVIRIEECSYDLEAGFTVCGTGVTVQSDDVFSIVDKAGEPSITITSPAADDELIKGQTYKIEWKAAEIEKVVIVLLTYNAEKKQVAFPGEEYYITKEVEAKKGFYSWSIPVDIAFESYPYYKILIEDASVFGLPGATRDISNNYFNIISPIVEKFDFQYAFGPAAFQHVLDTRTNTYKHVSCPDYPDITIKEYVFKLSETEKQEIYNSITENNLFNLEKSKFIEYCEPDGACLSVDPPIRAELSIIINDKNIISLIWETYLIPNDSEYIRSQNVKRIIDRIISDKSEQMGIKKEFCTYF